MELVAESVTVRFGGLTALDSVSLSLVPGEILGLIGPNGAGKTTLVNVLSGFQRPYTGRVRIGAKDATGEPSFRYALSGVARTFQAVRLFLGMTVAENVEVSCVNIGMSRSAARIRAVELLKWGKLSDKADRIASTLSYGDERRVGLIRALALRPKFLLLDEPAAGLNAAEADELRGLIGHIREAFECAVLLIEHNMALVMNICHRLHVLDGGRTIATGTPAEVQAAPAFRRAYLGSRAV
jgi:branched-chain amino acid transport system ATP-binding protein